MTDLRANLCPVCHRLLCKGSGPVQIKCSYCKALLQVEPERIVIIEEPNYNKYLLLYSLGKTSREYGNLRNMEIPF